MGGAIKEFVCVEELAAAGLGSPARLRIRAKNEQWKFQDVSSGRGRPQRHYAIASLPEAWRIKLARQAISESPADAQHRAELPAPLSHATVLATSDFAAAENKSTTYSAAASYHLLSDKAQRRCDARLEVIAAFDDFRKGRMLSGNDAIYAFVANYRQQYPEAKISGPTLKRWLGKKRKGGTAAVSGDSWGVRKNATVSYIDEHPEIRSWLIAKDIELNGAAKEARVSIEEILRGARGEFGDAAPSYKQIQRFLNRFRDEYRVERSFHSAPDAARGRFMPAFGDASAGVYDFMQRLELDGSPSDCITLSCGRAQRRRIIMLTDIFTRQRWAIVAPTESGEWTGRLFAKVFSTVGIPAEVVTDNGSGFVSARIRAMLGDLDIEYHSVQRFRGDLKPFVESAFRFVQQRVAMLPGYAGRDLAMRHDLRGRLSMPQRSGRSEAEILNVRLTDADLERFIDDYLGRVYANTPHEGLNRKTPNQVLAAWVQHGGSVRRIKDASAIYGLLMLTGETRRVVKKGIQVDNAYYQSPSFVPFMNKDVLVGRHHEPGKIVVWSLGERREFICVALNRELMSPAQQREVAMDARKMQRERMSLFKRELREISKENPTPLHESVMHAFRDAPQIEVPSTGFENAATLASSESIAALQSVDAPKLPHYEEAELVEGSDVLRAIEAKRVTQTSQFEEDQQDWERWLALQEASELTDDDRGFIARYEASPECRSRKMVFDIPRKAVG